MGRRRSDRLGLDTDHPRFGCHRCGGLRAPLVHFLKRNGTAVFTNHLVLQLLPKIAPSGRPPSNMTILARYVHTNLIAHDWQALARFYQEIFGCSPIPPERDLAGPEMDAGTGIPGTHLRGLHLRLPGYGDTGPTLEILSYDALIDRQPTAVNRPGYGHIAFSVEDVTAARQEVLAKGGTPIGEVVSIEVGGARLTWCYVADPEDNAIELQSWAR
jgi:glyoxylase I family protein